MFIILVRQQQENSSTPFVPNQLTPHAMKWADDLWICDLRTCLIFWRSILKQKNWCFRQLLNSFYEQNDFHIVISNNPWTGVLVARTMQERDLPGIIDLRDTFGISMIQQTSWSVWWTCLDQFIDHLKINSHSKPTANIKSDLGLITPTQLRAMREITQKLNFKTPQKLATLSPSQLQRRFGKALTQIWLNGFETSQSTLYSRDHFPWQTWRMPDSPTINRHLEFDINQWGVIEPLLRDDLDRLCHLNSWDVTEKIVSLEWVLTFDDMTSRPLILRFRHPHSLHQQMGSHRTALLQAYYSFCALQNKKDFIPNEAPNKVLQSENLSYTRCEFSPLMIRSWTISAKERIHIPPQMKNLFDDQPREHERLMELENLCSTELLHFELKSNWQPEHSFGTTLPQGHQQSLTSSFNPLSDYQISASCRPLLILDRPVPFDHRGSSLLWRFTERTAIDWWHSPDLNFEHLRDYYRVAQKDQKYYWIFKNQKGRCYVHGIFA
jgi:hypothetical protein